MGGIKKFENRGEVVNLGMWKWWKKYRQKQAEKKKAREEPDVYWVPRRFGDKIILCPKPNTSKYAKGYL